MAGITDMLAHYLARGLIDFRGLELIGTIPVPDKVLNELIRQYLTQGMGAANPSHQAPPSQQPQVPVAELVRLVKRAEIEAHEGRIVLHVELRVDDRPPEQR